MDNVYLSASLITSELLRAGHIFKKIIIILSSRFKFNRNGKRSKGMPHYHTDQLAYPRSTVQAILSRGRKAGPLNA